MSTSSDHVTSIADTSSSVGIDNDSTLLEDCPSQTTNIIDRSIDEDTQIKEEGNFIRSTKRQKRSHVWMEFKEISLLDGTKKAQCVHCKSNLSIISSGVTSHLSRHLKYCPRRKVTLWKQKIINFQPVGSIVDNSSSDLPFMDFGSKYDQAKMKMLIAHWILMHEHPFMIVEEEGFHFVMKMSNVNYEKISRKTIKKECLEVYEAEKKKLKTSLKEINKISLTTDLWKSQNQKIEYMVITGHFIDSSWKLQKRILSFVHVPSPRCGTDIADAIYKCLEDWEIENKVFSISVDNAAYNDVCLRALKDDFSRNRKLVCGGKLFYVRCCAHILNLLVQDGFVEIKDIIENVRESVKFINQSEARLRIFSEIVQQLQLGAKRLVIDCPTHWNSTYDMLSSALKFKDAFPIFQDREPIYDFLPSVDEWEKVEMVCEILEVFNAVTNIISGSDYTTSNLYLSEVYRVKEVLNFHSTNENIFIRTMVGKMKQKFENYWGECNLLMAIASILDPRVKLRLIEMCFPEIYSEAEAIININLVRRTLFEIYDDYIAMWNVEISNEETISSNSSMGVSISRKSHSSSSSGWSKLMTYVKQVEIVNSPKSELEKYLEEGVYICEETSQCDFDVLEWWKVNNLKFRVLSKMAVDILAIPLSTVGSESTFSAGDRVIDPYHSSLAPNTVQALICSGDWVRTLHNVKKNQKAEKKPVEIMLSIT